jgi:hypothetical protein
LVHAKATAMPFGYVQPRMQYAAMAITQQKANQTLSIKPDLLQVFWQW